MECNKDEALRAKQIAERRMQDSDFAGALKFAEKAQKLFPEIENISQMLAVCAVHCSALNKLSGSEMDWYGILQSEQFTDEATIKKQYRKLALLLHPDKNKFSGAEGAFKMIGEANRSTGSSSHQQAQQKTFWTGCPHCYTRFQYYKSSVNAKIRCQRCSKYFTAYDLGHQGVQPGPPRSLSNNRKESLNPQKAASQSNVGNSCGSRYEDKSAAEVEKKEDGRVAARGGKKGVRLPKSAVSRPGGPQPSTNSSRKRVRPSSGESRESCKTGGGDDVKEGNIQENGSNFPGLNAGGHKEANHATLAMWRLKEEPVAGRWSNVNYSAGCDDAASAAGGQKGELKRKASSPSEEIFLKKKGAIEQSDVSKEEASKSGHDNTSSKTDDVSQLNSDPEIFVYPDPDFTDFAKDKADFAVNQLWAIYDTVDCMPRFYARIKKIFSPGFKLLITWLEPNPDDQGEIDWCNEELPVSCGKYKHGGTEETMDHLMFSHQMQFMKGNRRGSYLIYPRKGETWAVFRNWDIRWSSDPQKNFNYEFEFVEILSDFVEEVGIEVAYLGKVKGFVCLFQQTKQIDILSFHIPPNELYRFSHQVPSFRMTGEESKGVPAASFELDPAALPINLVGNGDLSDVKMENGNIKGVDDLSSCKSSEYKMKQKVDCENIHTEKVHVRNDAERVDSILRRSPRKLYKKNMDNDPVNASHYVAGEEDSKDISHGTLSQPDVSSPKCQGGERVKTPNKHQKNDCAEHSLKLRRSPRDLGKKTGQCTTDEGICKPSIAKKDANHMKESSNIRSPSFPPSFTTDHKVLEALSYDFDKEKSEEKFQPDQIWALCGDRGGMPRLYAQVKKIEFIPNFRLHMALLEPCAVPKGTNQPVSCGLFTVKNGKTKVFSRSAFSHELRAEPVGKNRYAIYPRKGEIWAVYKDQEL
ncbi:DnaJ domain containing protein [Quillaja saponaria]|uniref:DnaJ domain containing protein n=1 Tax=Quillaja saponaria TaxID=32244 RepID=A0AAD7Q256_QUISA|nr:DnaJ domain containing protein [Quillaja saponaria]KAJ7973408.1 DnaJ domain containing protein [Quillaja saponaria]